MAPGRADDALTWDGDDDPTLDVGTSDAADPDPAPADGGPATPSGRPAETGVLPEGYTAVGKGSETVAVTSAADAPREDDTDSTPAMGNAELISLGVLGGFSVLYAVGWLIGGLRLQGSRPYLVTDLMYQGALWLAVAAPLIWFASVLLLTAGRRVWIRFAWLIAGAILLVPWPFIMIGAVGR